MLRQSLLCMIIGFAALPAVAQTYKNDSPDVLRSVQTYKSKESLTKLLNDQYHLAMSDTWPTNFPLPVYTSNVVKKSFTHSTKGRPSAGATLITNDQPKAVFDFYNSACKRAGWNVKVPSAKSMAELSKNGELYMLTADQGKQSIYLSCSKNRANAGTLVSISWTKAP